LDCFVAALLAKTSNTERSILIASSLRFSQRRVMLNDLS
jgi:hypothetical protein